MFEDISRVVLLSDMDGTLLNSRKEITDADRSAIERFTALGGRFTVATGRTIQSFDQRLSTIISAERPSIPTPSLSAPRNTRRSFWSSCLRQEERC